MKKNLMKLMVLALALALTGYGRPVQPAESDQEADIPGWTPDQETEILLGQDLYLTGVGSYTGPFVEDGQDRPVEGMLAVLVENRSAEDLQYAELSAHTEDGDALFTVTALPAGASALLLEQGGQTVPPDRWTGVELTTSAFAPMELYPERLELETEDGQITVTNRGDNLEGDLFVYYKNLSGTVYLGGITYRARISGGLSAGEGRTTSSRHYTVDGSQLLFVTGEADLG